MAFFGNDEDDYPQREPSFLSKVWSAVKWVGMAILAVVGVTALLRTDTVKNWLDKATEKKEGGIVIREGLGTKFNNMFDKNVATNPTYQKVAGALSSAKDKVLETFGFETRPASIVAAERTQLEKSADDASSATVEGAKIGAIANTALAVGKKVAGGLQTLGPDGKPIDKPTRLQNKLTKLQEDLQAAETKATEANKALETAKTKGLSDEQQTPYKKAAVKAEEAVTKAETAVTEGEKAVADAVKAAAAPRSQLRAVKWLKDTHANIGEKAADIGEAINRSKLANNAKVDGAVELLNDVAKAKYVKPVTGLIGKVGAPALKGAGYVGAAYGAAMDGMQTKALYDAKEYRGAALEGVNTVANIGNTMGAKGMGVAEIIQDSSYLLRKLSTGGLVDGKEDVSKGMLGTLVDHKAKEYAEKKIQAVTDKLAQEQQAHDAEAQAKYNALSDQGKAEVQAVMKEAQERGLKNLDGLGAIGIAERRLAKQEQEAVSAPVTPAKPKDEKENRGPRKHQPVGPG